MNRLIACTTTLVLSGGLVLLGTVAAHADPNINEVPDSTDDSYSMVQGETLSIAAGAGLLANDVATGPSPLAVVEWFDYDPTELVVNKDGSFTFTPQPGFTGLSTFQYKAGAGNWWGYARTVSIMVNPLPAPAVGQADYYSTPQDTTLTIPANGVLANDVGAIAAIDVQNLPEGLTPQFDGSFVYAPPAGFVGDVSWSYRMSDGNALSDWIPVTISVTPASPATPVTPVTPSSPVTPVTQPAPAAPTVLDDTELPTLAYTGAGDVSTWLLVPALVLLVLGAAGAFIARRRIRIL